MSVIVKHTSHLAVGFEISFIYVAYLGQELEEVSFQQ